MSTPDDVYRAMRDAKAILDGQDVPTRAGKEAAMLVETWKAQGLDVEAMKRMIVFESSKIGGRTYTLSLRGPFPGR